MSVEALARKLLEEQAQEVKPVEPGSMPHIVIAQLQEEVATTLWGENE